MIDERLEYLMTRQLDGRISEAERLELNKTLIRSPEAHRVFDEYQANDALATEALRRVFDPPTPASAEPPILDVTVRSRWRGWSVMRPLFVAAAAIVLAVMIRGIPWTTNDGPAQGQQAQVVSATPGPAETPAMADARPESKGESPQNMLTPRYAHEYMPRDFLAVLDDQSRNIYLLEMDRPRMGIVPVRMRY